MSQHGRADCPEKDEHEVLGGPVHVSVMVSFGV